MNDNETTPYYARLEGIAIRPWPAQPLLICCNLCDRQIVGQSFENVLSMTYGMEKFTRPNVPARIGRYEEIEIELKTFDGQAVTVDSVTVQLTLDINV